MFIGFGVSMRVGLRGWWGGVGWGCGLRVEEGGVRSGGVEEWRSGGDGMEWMEGMEGMLREGGEGGDVGKWGGRGREGEGLGEFGCLM